MEQDSDQKIVVLTGASRGIGHATVKKFASENWRVITCSRQAFDDRCPWPGGEMNHIQLDLSNPNQTIEAIEEIKSKIGSNLHALVNNAGISPKGKNGLRLNTLNTDLKTWGQVFHVNFFASVVLARGLQKELASAKGAIEGLTLALAAEFAPNVRVNCIAPSLTNSKISNFLLKNEKVAEGIAKMHPMKRIGQGDDSASVAKFLLTDESSWITGQILGVDGGRSSVA